jgi:membrane-bound metal-dependent hydrolase YbcI (DUF457 family)
MRLLGKFVGLVYITLLAIVLFPLLWVMQMAHDWEWIWPWTDIAWSADNLQDDFRDLFAQWVGVEDA